LGVEGRMRRMMMMMVMEGRNWVVGGEEV